MTRPLAHPVKFTSTDKVLFPRDGITKGDLIAYYERIADTMLPHVTGRPVTLQRFPDGIDGQRFYQKETPDYFPDWIEEVKVDKQPTARDPKDWQCQVIVDRPETLLFLANLNCITLHAWLSRKPEIYRPDKLIWDLDPSTDDFSAVKDGARRLRDLLTGLGLPTYLMTTGSRGLHVVVPIRPELTFEDLKPFTKAVAERLVADDPSRFTIEHRKGKRGDRVFVDYLRNEYAATAVVPYSVRARDGAPVAVPIPWEELNDPHLTSQRYTIRNLFEVLRERPDPWADWDRQAMALSERVLGWPDIPD